MASKFQMAGRHWVPVRRPGLQSPAHIRPARSTFLPPSHPLGAILRDAGIYGGLHVAR